MDKPMIPSNTGSAKIDKQGHTTNGLHGNAQSAQARRGSPAEQGIKTTRS